MELIHFQGLNCFYECVLSIASSFGLHYPDAFATLWSETVFRYDAYRKAYLSKRLFLNLEAMGAKVKCFDCFSPEEVERHIAHIREGDLMAVGMDAYHTPWNPMYRAFHGPHYFIVLNGRDETLTCADPTYGRRDERMARREIIARTFDVCRIERVVKKPARIEAMDEAREILRTNGATRRALLSRINCCADAEQEEILLLARYIDAMIHNRHLYQFFYNQRQGPWEENPLLFDDRFFARWEAVKNGLYKAAASKKRRGVLDEVDKEFSQVMDEETALAEAALKRPVTANI